MKIVDQLNRIINNYEIYEEAGYFDSYYNELANFLEKKLVKSPFKKKNAQILIEHMEILLEYTSFNNNNWVFYSSLIDNHKFFDTLADNIDKFRFSEHIWDVFQSLATKYSDLFFSDKMINKLSKLDVGSMNSNSIYDAMNPEQKKKYIKLLYENNKPIYIPLDKMSNESLSFVKEHIIHYLKYSNVFFLKDELKDDKKVMSQIIDYLDNNLECTIDSIVAITQPDSQDCKEYHTLISLLFEDICRSENVNFSEIEYLSSGAFSTVFTVKNKVIKISKKDRQTKMFPNNPYIVAPLLRREFIVDGFKVFIEVTERVKTGEIKEEELYNLYRNIRNLGLIWGDVASRNAGRLIKDNRIHWVEDISPSDETLGLEQSVKDIVLPAGSLVVLDADFIYKEGDPNFEYVSNSLHCKFEERYQHEKAYKLSNDGNNEPIIINVVQDELSHRIK